MICVSLGRMSAERCRRILRTLSFAEVRLDLVRWSQEEVRAIFSLPLPLIATCRPGRLSNAARLRRLMEAVKAGASYVDIENDAPSSDFHLLLSFAREEGRRVIISYHRDDSTPSLEVLKQHVRTGFKRGADIVKIACRVRTIPEALRIVSLYGEPEARRGRLLAFGMGRAGSWTRIAAPLLGAPFTYARPDGHPGTAPGQIAHKDLKKILGLLGGRP